MMFAQTIEPNALGSWMLLLGGVMAMYWLGRQIFISHFPVKVAAEAYVTQSQFDSFKTDMRGEFVTFKHEMRSEFKDMNAEHKAQLEKLDEHMRDGFHRQAQAQQTVLSTVSFVKGMLGGKHLPPDEELT